MRLLITLKFSFELINSRERQRQMAESSRLDEEMKAKEVEANKVKSSFRGFSTFSRFRRDS